MGKAEFLIFLIQFIYWAKQLIIYALVGRIIMSWMYMGQRRPNNKLAYFLNDVTEPVLRIARKIPHRIGMLDIAPIIAMLGLDILATFVIQLLKGLL